MQKTGKRIGMSLCGVIICAIAVGVRKEKNA